MIRPSVLFAQPGKDVQGENLVPFLWQRRRNAQAFDTVHQDGRDSFGVVVAEHERTTREVDVDAVEVPVAYLGTRRVDHVQEHRLDLRAFRRATQLVHLVKMDDRIVAPGLDERRRETPFLAPFVGVVRAEEEGGVRSSAEGNGH